MHYFRDIYNRSAPVHTYPFSFEHATFSLRIRLPSTGIRWTRSMETELFENVLQSGTCWKRCFRVYVRTDENGTFRKRSLEWNFLKTLFSRVRVDRQKRNFSKTLRTQYQFKSTPRNIRNLFKMADGRFSFLSFILWLISNLINKGQNYWALIGWERGHFFLIGGHF